MRSTLGAAGAVVLALVLVAGLATISAISTELRPTSAAPVSSGSPGGAIACTIESGSACVEAGVGSGWFIDPVFSWCSTNVSTEPIPPGLGTNDTTNTTTTSSYCHPSVGYIGFNMTSNGTLAGVLSAPGAFGAWLVPVAGGCSTIYYTIADLPVSCPPPLGWSPPSTWNWSSPGAGSIDLAAPGTGPGVLPPSTWEIILADTGPAPEWVTVTASVTLAPA